MILTKKYLNELTQKRNLNESIKFNQSIHDSAKSYDVFLSYSYHDLKFALKIVNLLNECGYSVYIDEKDSELDRNNINRRTAEHIANKMDQCKGLIYIHSKSSKVSNWCPWELGYFSGKKKFRCASLPIIENEGESFPKQEFLELYPYVDYCETKKGYNFFINDRTVKNKYTNLKDWLIGGTLKKHQV